MAHSEETEDGLPVRDEPVSVVLAEMTGRPREEFEPDEDIPIPEIDELEVVPEDEW